MLCMHAQLCLTLGDPMDCSPPGSSAHGTFQARILEWVAISFFMGSSQSRDRTYISCLAGSLSHVGSPREDRGSLKFLIISFIWVVSHRKPLVLSIPNHGVFWQSRECSTNCMVLQYGSATLCLYNPGTLLNLPVTRCSWSVEWAE